MTKVELPFDLSAPLDEKSMNRIAEVYRLYGILRINVEPGARKLTVEYDATRFTPEDVQSALARAGLPLAQRSI
jgi:allophanate hydrolase subunit 1